MEMAGLTASLYLTDTPAVQRLEGCPEHGWNKLLLHFLLAVDDYGSIRTGYYLKHAPFSRVDWTDEPNSIENFSNLKFYGLSVIIHQCFNLREDCGQLFSKQRPIRRVRCSNKSVYTNKVSAFLVDGAHHKLSITVLWYANHLHSQAW